MLVDVVELRHRGVKRPRAQVLADKPVRAVLTLQAGRPGWHAGQRNAPLLAGLLVPGETNWAREPLDPARVTAIKGTSLLIVGMQEIPIYGGRQVEVHRQAWWCRIVQTSP